MDSDVKTIVVGSRNPVKLQAVQRAFRRAFPEDVFHVVPVSVSSGVADQPEGDHEALSGALNRARAASNQVPTAAYGVGIEGAINDTAAGMEAFAWVAIVSQRHVGKGRTATFYLPEGVAELVRKSAELGEAIDTFFDTVDAKRNEGAIGLLTRGILGRAELYEPGIIVALIPFLTPDLYGDQK